MTNKKRSPLWPDIPTVAASGYPELAFEGLIGVFAPRGTPDERASVELEYQSIQRGTLPTSKLPRSGLSSKGLWNLSR